MALTIPLTVDTKGCDSHPFSYSTSRRCRIFYILSRDAGMSVARHTLCSDLIRVINFCSWVCDGVWFLLDRQPISPVCLAYVSESETPKKAFFSSSALCINWNVGIGDVHFSCWLSVRAAGSGNSSISHALFNVRFRGFSVEDYHSHSV